MKRTKQESLDMLEDYVGDLDSLYENVDAEEEFYRNKKIDRILMIRNIIVSLFVFVVLVFCVGMARTLQYGKNNSGEYYLITKDYENMVKYSDAVSVADNGLSIYNYVLVFADSSSPDSIYTICNSTSNKSEILNNQLKTVQSYYTTLTDESYYPNLKSTQENHKSIYNFNKKLTNNLSLIVDVLKNEINSTASTIDKDKNNISDDSDAILAQILENNSDVINGLEILFSNMQTEIYG